MIFIDIIKIFEDKEIYALHKLFYRENDINQSSTLYTSKDVVLAVTDGILDVAEKLDIEINVRWIYPNDNK